MSSARERKYRLRVISAKWAYIRVYRSRGWNGGFWSDRESSGVFASRSKALSARRSAEEYIRSPGGWMEGWNADSSGTRRLSRSSTSPVTVRCSWCLSHRSFGGYHCSVYWFVWVPWTEPPYNSRASLLALAPTLSRLCKLSRRTITFFLSIYSIPI